MDTANELQKELIKTSVFEDLQSAYNDMKADRKSFDLFRDFQELQFGIQKKQMQGIEPAEDELKNAQDLASQMNQSNTIQALMKAEQSLNEVLGKVNQVVTKPISDLYSN